MHEKRATTKSSDMMTSDTCVDVSIVVFGETSAEPDTALGGSI